MRTGMLRSSAGWISGTRTCQRFGVILADTSARVGWMDADISRLLTVTERDLPVIVEHLALACEKLTGIAKMMASPRETEAGELFKSGTHALATAAAMARKGAPGLADTWFGEAIEDLGGATNVFRQVPEIWYNLGLARAGRDPSSRTAADAFEEAVRYAVAKDRLGLAAESVLLAAAELRSVGDADGARNLLHEYLPLLDRCAELYVSLAVHHGETGLLTRAFKIAPLLAAAVQAKIDELRVQATGQRRSVHRSRRALGRQAARSPWNIRAASEPPAAPAPARRGSPPFGAGSAGSTASSDRRRPGRPALVHLNACRPDQGWVLSLPKIVRPSEDG